MAMPVQTTGWNSGGANRIEPSAGKKILGWILNEKPSSSYFNWLFFIIEAWLVWLNGLFGYANTWTAQNTFTGILSAISGVTNPALTLASDSAGKAAAITSHSTVPAVTIVVSGGGLGGGTGDGLGVGTTSGTAGDFTSTSGVAMKLAGNPTREALLVQPQIQPSAPGQGAIIFNQGTLKHQGWDGSAWHDLY